MCMLFTSRSNWANEKRKSMWDLENIINSFVEKRNKYNHNNMHTIKR